RIPVEQSLRHGGAGIKIGKRSYGWRYYDSTKLRQAELGEIDLGVLNVRRRGDVRQKSAQLLPPLSAGRTNFSARKQQAKILLQSTVNRVLERKRQHPSNRFRWHAARERT